jgi:hypothetical protein
MTTATINFVKFPFTYQGVNFVSRISEESRYLPQIKAMGSAFIDMNISAIDEVIPDLVSLDIDELNERLEIINAGGTQMFLELDGE